MATRFQHDRDAAVPSVPRRAARAHYSAGRSPAAHLVLRQDGPRGLRPAGYYEQGDFAHAVQDMPIFEENGPEFLMGVDSMRAVRSFDPCLPCGVHMFTGRGKLLEARHVPMSGLMER